MRGKSTTKERSRQKEIGQPPRKRKRTSERMCGMFVRYRPAPAACAQNNDADTGEFHYRRMRVRLCVEHERAKTSASWRDREM